MQKKQITIKEAQTKYGILVSKMQRLDKTKFYLCENGDVVDSLGDTRYFAPKIELSEYKGRISLRVKYGMQVAGKIELDNLLDFASKHLLDATVTKVGQDKLETYILK